jgi:hypothetical protein
MSNNNNANSSVGSVSSSKYPPSDAGVKNLVLDGYLAANVKAGEAVSAGSVLLQSLSAAKTVLLANGAGNKRVIGVAVKEAKLGENVLMAVGGEFWVLVNNTVTPGHFLTVTATPGVAASSGTVGAVGDFAIATTGGVGTGSQLVLVSARFKKVELA